MNNAVNWRNGKRSMANIAEWVRYAGLSIVVISLPFIAACGSNHADKWQEEVKLLDGRVIHITQKRRYDRGEMPRECWLIFNLPEFGDQEITWHQNLLPRVLNVHEGKLYVIGLPITQREYFQHGKPNPPYMGFRYESNQWQRIPFGEIPEAIYDTNLLIESHPAKDMKFATFSMKAEEIANGELRNRVKRVDPNYRW